VTCAIGELEFWRALFMLVAMVLVATLAVPQLSELVARWLHAHAVALAAWYKVTRAAGRTYRRIHHAVMEEMGQ
jgi:hypothetical protein